MMMRITLDKKEQRFAIFGMFFYIAVFLVLIANVLHFHYILDCR